MIFKEKQKIFEWNTKYEYKLHEGNKPELNDGEIYLSSTEILDFSNQTTGNTAALILEAAFSNFQATRDGGKFDGMINGNDFAEVKSVTKNKKNESKLTVVPSYMLGVGRVYDLKKHLAHIELVKGYIYVDVRNSPMIKIYSTLAQKLKANVFRTKRGKKVDQYLGTL
jgi:hypothetical protein